MASRLIDKLLVNPNNVPVVQAAAQVCADPLTPQSSALHEAMVTAGLWPADGKTK